MADTKTPTWLSLYPRSYIDPALTIFGWNEIEPLYRSLSECQIDNVEQLKQWLTDWSEVEGVVHEFATTRYVDMTCDTGSEEKKSAYLAVVRDIEPKIAEWDDKLNRKFLAAKGRDQLPADEFTQFDRGVRVSAELFLEKNIPLKTRLSELGHRYQEVSGSLMVEFEGEERTLQQMGLFLRENDRSLRERAWRASAERRLMEKDTFEEIFDEMVALRHQVATNLGLPDYQAYSFKSKLRDYTPEDCATFHNAIEKTAMPVARAINERRRKEMGIESVAPWDTACDPLGRSPLRPFADTTKLADGVSAIFHEVDGRLGAFFDSIRFSMDLDSRKGKAPGGYQTTFAERRLPFIFTNAVGVHDDVNTLLHEGGHAFHTLMCRDQSMIWNRHAAMEFAEVASMSMELVCGDRLAPFYGSEEERGRAWREKLESSVDIFGWVAQIDSFQSWIYAHPEHTREERGAAWLAVNERFNTGIDWSGAPDAVRQNLWHRQLHIFEVPFYYIEYAIAEIGALQVWRNYRHNSKKAIDAYLSALAVGGAKTPVDLFAKADIRFDFTEQLLGELMDMVAEELEL
jgi:oligoendopeptidase F